jgi:hypothetical protein
MHQRGQESQYLRHFPTLKSIESSLPPTSLHMGLASSARHIGVTPLLGEHGYKRYRNAQAERQEPQGIDAYCRKGRGKLGWIAVIFGGGSHELTLGNGPKYRGDLEHACCGAFGGIWLQVLGAFDHKTVRAIISLVLPHCRHTVPTRLRLPKITLPVFRLDSIKMVNFGEQLTNTGSTQTQ